MESPLKQMKWKEPASFIRARKRALGEGLSRRRQLIVFLSAAGALALILGLAFARSRQIGVIALAAAIS